MKHCIRNWLSVSLCLGGFFFAFSFIVFSGGSLQAGETGQTFFSKSLEKLNALSGFQCRFEQRMMFADGGVQQYSGELAVRRPGKFRWQYKLPYEQLYVGNGSVIWHYEPDLMQAERLVDMESVDPVVMRLLNGRMSVKNLHVLDEQKDAGNRLWRYQVDLGESAPVWLAFAEDSSLVYIEREDVLGNANRMILKDCAYIAPSENLFSFSAPEGVDVIDMRMHPRNAN